MARLTAGRTWRQLPGMNYKHLLTIEPGTRGGRPCIRGLRITVYDVLDYLAGGMSEEEILRDFPDLTFEGIRACLAFGATSTVTRVPYRPELPPLSCTRNRVVTPSAVASGICCFTDGAAGLLATLAWTMRDPDAISAAQPLTCTGR